MELFPTKDRREQQGKHIEEKQTSSISLMNRILILKQLPIQGIQLKYPIRYRNQNHQQQRHQMVFPHHLYHYQTCSIRYRHKRQRHQWF